eukprot:TRINITY_DN10411_c0_g1_i4.p1 TRINITY_DN10411_c0_g1~~TRINITY_DN10411_c0_g1_i4.p1  ORF type:complete len:458 (+),score=55.91 TRINITY_DN10411_c0_g1_i4:519-1892(+)
MRWRGAALKDVSPWWNFLAKTNPFIRFSRQRSDGSWLRVFQTEPVQANLNPVWDNIEIRLEKLCMNRFNSEIKVECFSHSGDNGEEFIGEGSFTLEQILNTTRVVSLTNPDVENPGTLFLDEVNIEERFDFIDFIRGGMQIAVVLAIDFTVSNGIQNSVDSLHAIHRTSLNDYQIAITKVLGTLLNYDYDQRVPVYGFGARPCFPNLKDTETSHLFPLTGNPERPEVLGVDGVLKTYSNALQYLEFSGPTYFSPILREAIKQANDSLSKGHDEYLILLILTDGEIYDLPETIGLMQEAANLPISIIIVGIGNADFGQMNILDGDQGLFTQKGGKVERDLCQFVPFNEYRDDADKLSEEVIAELPRQIVDYKKLRHMVPKHISEEKPTSLNRIPTRIYLEGLDSPKGKKMPASASKLTGDAQMGSPRNGFHPTQGQQARRDSTTAPLHMRRQSLKTTK